MENLISENLIQIEGPFVEAEPEKQKDITVSYSQYQRWCKCPHSWKLAYIDRLSKYEGNLYTFLGEALHTALQKYVEVLYTKSAPEADMLDLYQIFCDGMKECRNNPTNKDVIMSDENYNEFLEDGKNILHWFTAPANRMKLFPSKVYEIIGIELPLKINVRKNISYCGYLDVVLKNKSTGVIKIIDFKSSTVGWNKYVKNDETKTNQLLLYKKFYSEINNIPLDMIDIEFVIFKRKLLESMSYSTDRCQKFVPANGKVSVKKAENSFNEFLNECFTEGGKHNKNFKFRKTPGKGGKNCRWCEFRETEHCNGKED